MHRRLFGSSLNYKTSIAQLKARAFSPRSEKGLASGIGRATALRLATSGKVTGLVNNAEVVTMTGLAGLTEGCGTS